MREKDDPRDAGPLARLSLQRLGAYAIEEAFIDGIEIRPEHVTIIQGDHRFVLPPKQASAFLFGMLRGRSWFLEASEPIEGHTTDPDTEAAGGGAGPSLVATLDSLLEFTKEIGILKSYEKDANARSVRIDISACSTTLSYTDTLHYLLDCIQDELRALRGGKRGTP
jgi:hypothetical protein